MLRVGLKFPQRGTVEELREVWDLAESAGFDHCWTFDHFVALGPDPAGDVFDGWTLLAAMAERTKRVRIGILVSGVTHRHPAVLAKIATTIDHLSNGRLEFGLGAAWNEPEHASLGIPFPSTAERMRRLGEACRIVKLLWTEPRATFTGRYYALADAVAEPKPVQKPHPPLWIGGEGEKRLLRIAARHADVWNHTSSDVEKSARLARVLDEHCAAVGRDPAAIVRSVQVFPGADADGALRLLEGLVDAGFSDFVLGIRRRREAEDVAALLPRVRALG